MKTYHLAVIPADGIGPEVIAAGRTVLDGLARHHGGVAFRYGDSGKPDGGPDHAGYAPRAMALDQVEVMRHLGLDRFAVAGHDRGGRVAHRMALDHPDRVSRLAVPTIGPAGE